MDGGENNMVKKIFISVFCVLFTLPFVFCAGAQTEGENEEHYYDEYDDYYEMEQDYIDSEVVDNITPNKKQSVIFIPAIILGAAAGLGVTYVVLNAVFAPPKPDPYFRKAEEKHKIVNKADTKIG